MTNLNNPQAFAKAFNDLDVTNDPRAIREAFEADQLADDDRNLYRAPDGLYFEVSRTLACGGVVTDSGIYLEPGFFRQCERVL